MQIVRRKGQGQRMSRVSGPAANNYKSKQSSNKVQSYDEEEEEYDRRRYNMADSGPIVDENIE